MTIRDFCFGFSFIHYNVLIQLITVEYFEVCLFVDISIRNTKPEQILKLFSGMIVLLLCFMNVYLFIVLLLNILLFVAQISNSMPLVALLFHLETLNFNKKSLMHQI